MWMIHRREEGSNVSYGVINSDKGSQAGNQGVHQKIK